MNNQQAFNKIWHTFIINGVKRNESKDYEIYNSFLFALFTPKQKEKLVKYLERYKYFTFFEYNRNCTNLFKTLWKKLDGIDEAFLAELVTTYSEVQQSEWRKELEWLAFKWKLKIPVLDNQEVFNIIWKKFIVDDLPLNSITSYEHLPHGCFIGALFTELEAKKLQNWCNRAGVYSIKALFEYEFTSQQVSKIKKLFKFCDSNFIVDMQMAHDGHNRDETKKDLKERLIKLAEIWNLTIPTST